MHTLIFDFSKVLLFPTVPSYEGSLNDLYKQKKDVQGFKFFDYFKLNQELLSWIHSHNQEYTIVLFTSETIQEAPELQEIMRSCFSKIYSAIKIGYSKKQPQAYQHIIDDLSVPPELITFIDDSKENIDTAKSVGIKTILFTTNETLFSQLEPSE